MRKASQLISIALLSQNVNVNVIIPEEDDKPVILKTRGGRYIDINDLTCDELGFDIKTPYCQSLFITNCRFRTLKGFPSKPCAKNLYIYSSTGFESFGGAFQKVERIVFKGTDIISLKDIPEKLDILSFKDCRIHSLEDLIGKPSPRFGISYQNIFHTVLQFSTYAEFRDYMIKEDLLWRR